MSRGSTTDPDVGEVFYVRAQRTLDVVGHLGIVVFAQDGELLKVHIYAYSFIQRTAVHL